MAERWNGYGRAVRGWECFWLSSPFFSEGEFGSVTFSMCACAAAFCLVPRVSQVVSQKKKTAWLKKAVFEKQNPTDKSRACASWLASCSWRLVCSEAHLLSACFPSSPENLSLASGACLSFFAVGQDFCIARGGSLQVHSAPVPPSGASNDGALYHHHRLAMARFSATELFYLRASFTARCTLAHVTVTVTTARED